MATLDTIRDAIPDYARDLKLNLGSVLATTGAPGLTEKQIWPSRSLLPSLLATFRLHVTSSRLLQLISMLRM